MSRHGWLFCLLLLSLCAPFAVHAESETRADTSFVDRYTDWVWEFDPADQPYPEYVADPRRPRMHFGVGYFDSDIDDTSSGRYLLDAGTRYTLFNVKTDPQGVNEFALDIEGGLFSQFDMANSQDSVGWDGILGAFAVYEWSDTLNVRVGYRHLSSHLGDEYIEKTGRQRINYTRDALVLGLAWELEWGLTAYVEPSWALRLGNDTLQDKWGVIGGLQYQGPFSYWNDSTALFAGGHVRSFEESDWEADISAVVGYLIKRDRRSSNIRLQLEFYHGRAILSEFAFSDDETYLIAGAVLDFY